LFEGGGDGGVGVGMVVAGVHPVVVVEWRGGREVVLMTAAWWSSIDGSGSHAQMYLCQCVLVPGSR